MFLFMLISVYGQTETVVLPFVFFINEKETKHLEHVCIQWSNTINVFPALLHPTNTCVFSRNTKTLLPVSKSPTSSPPGAPPGPPPSPPPFGSRGPIQSCGPRFSPSVPIPAGPNPTACALSSEAGRPSLDGPDACFTSIITIITSILKKKICCIWVTWSRVGFFCVFCFSYVK